jgi:acyl-coenzyme A thioesterase PaaI-like protein
MDQTSHEKLLAAVDSFIKNKVPMMTYAGVKLEEVDNEHCVIKIPLTKETKNHLESMYFGALSIGADAAGGLIAYYRILQTGKPVSLVFKDFTANFLRRPLGDVFFTCNDGKAIGELVDQAIATGKRENMTVTISATVEGEELPVAEFTLTLSLKLQTNI